MNEDLKSKLIQAILILIIITILIGVITIIRYFWPVILIGFLILLIPKNILNKTKEKIIEIYDRYFRKQESQYNPENDKKNIIDAEIVDDE